MFDPIRRTHDQIVRRAVEVTACVDAKTVADAFLASLSTRRLDIRSALGSYAVLRHLLAHDYEDLPARCPVCGEYNRPDEDIDLNVLNFERHKWGGVRHERPYYATFDMEQFLRIDSPKTSPGDLVIFRNILTTVEGVPPETTASQLQAKLGGVLPSTQAEREKLIDLLGYTGILAIPDHPGFRDGFPPLANRLSPPHWGEMGYPACWWKGRYGIDRAAVQAWFPALDF